MFGRSPLIVISSNESTMMAHVKPVLAGSTVLLWTILSIYVGAASFLHAKALQEVARSTNAAGSYDFPYGEVTLNFATAEDLRAFIRQERLGQTFPWAVDVPSEMVPLVLAVAAACLGGTVAILRQAVLDGRVLWQLPFVGRPLFGSAIGLMLFLVAALLPTVMTTEIGAYRPESVLAVAFFGGLFSERTFTWIESRTAQIFTKGGPP